jgi:hypothetical protein
MSLLSKALVQFNRLGAFALDFEQVLAAPNERPFGILCSQICIWFWLAMCNLP